MKLFRIYLYLFVYLSISLWGFICYRNLKKRRLFFIKTTSKWAKFALKFMNFEVEVVGKENIPEFGGNFFVCNHLSYLDIPIIASVVPTLFITSVDLKIHLFQALIATMGGSLFIERRNKTRLLADIQATKSVLNSGLPIFLFPEGTTSDGTTVMKFKASMFAAAEDTRVVPVCIKYLELNGEKVDESNRDNLYYYGKVKFFHHFIGLSKIKKAKVRVNFLTSEVGKLGRKEVCKRCQEKILAEYSVD